MTDRQLDEKLEAAFGNIRADTAVKARIRKGLTGDSMENRKITVTENETVNNVVNKEGKAAVNRSGRIVAAAAAAIVAVGGGAYLLKDGFDKVDTSPVVAGRETTSDEDTAAEGYTIEGLEEFFDPSGYTLYDKFGKDADIWKLSSGSFLVREVSGEGAEYYQYDGQLFHYFLYDGTKNAVVKEIQTLGSGIKVYDDCFAVWSNYSQEDENGYPVLDCDIYDLDLEPIREDVMVSLGKDGRGYPLVNEDKTISTWIGTSDPETGSELYRLIDEDGTEVFSTDEGGHEFLLASPEIASDRSTAWVVLYGDEGTSLYVKGLKEGYDTYRCSLALPEMDPPELFSMGGDICTLTGDTPEIVKLTSDGSAVSSDLTGENFTDVDSAYVTPDCNYLFTLDDKYSNDSGSCELKVYDISSDMELIYSEVVDGLNLGEFSGDGMDLIYDEVTGDVCISGFFDPSIVPGGRADKVITFNVAKEEFTNFGIKGSEQTENDSAENLIIPDVTGMTEDKAIAELEKAGFSNVVMRERLYEKLEDGLAIMTEPEAGKAAAADEEITIYISKGPLATLVTVPNVVGLDEEKAVDMLTESGLTANIQVMPHEGDAGKVIEQSVAPDSLVKSETVVIIYVPEDDSAADSLLIDLDMPEGIHGAYTVDICKDDEVFRSMAFENGEDVAGGQYRIEVEGEGQERITVNIRNDETGREVEYAVFDIDHENNESALVGSFDKEGLLAITPREEAAVSEAARS
ncbi:PASTA domain-containing protein [Ruminococcus sp.]|uniref:PASTA domain-containing protein n=1 Tax=Ruminococcus sp. TaxID=41978 RepID=UPI0025F4BAA2|nr:PASTA domain-containing protein [Ruminococcus sp.]MBQ8966821.1 PASTA domain-containing protein [Ruminococcus sp.]